MKPTIREISQASGYSSATVSNVLNGKTNAHSETSEQVMRVARELGYFRAGTLKKIRFVVFRADGFIVDDPSFLAMYMDGTQKECRKYGYELSVQYLDRTQPGYERQASMLCDDASAISVVIASEMNKEDAACFEHASGSVVMLHFWDDRLNGIGIVIDNEAAAAAQVAFLKENGHRRIGYLRNSIPFVESLQREEYFRREISRQGLICEDHWMIPLRPAMEGAYEDMLAYLKEKRELPEAFIADNDILAAGAMRAMKEKGISIPDDVSLIGFGDMPFAQITTPSLCTMRIPKQEIGALAVRITYALNEDTIPVRMQIRIPPKLVERESVRKIRAVQEEA